MEDELYNAMIIALSIGIVIVILTLIFIRPPPEHFSELYFSNHTEIPSMINPYKTYITDFKIVNHEGKETQYNVSIEADLGNRTIVFDNETIFIEKGKHIEMHLPYRLPDFERAKITIKANDLDIHFWVNKEEDIIEYSDLLAYQSCLKTLIVPEEDVVISARGAYRPHMAVRIDGNVVFEQIINHTDFREYNVGKIGTTLDIIFDNDKFDKELQQDTNLYIEYIKIGTQTYSAKTGVIDRGKGATAFDCRDTLEREGSIAWNAALRFKFD